MTNELESTLAAGTGRVFTVIKYDRDAAVGELLLQGASPNAIQAATSIPRGFPLLTNLADALPLRFVLEHLLLQWAKPKKQMRRARSLDSATAAAYDLMQWFEHLDALGLSYDDEVDQSVFDEFTLLQSDVPSGKTGKVLAESTVRRRAFSVIDLCGSDPFKRIGKASFNPRIAPYGGLVADQQIHPLTVEEWLRLVTALGSFPSACSGTRKSGLRRLYGEWALRTGIRRTEGTTIPLSAVQPVLEGDLTARDEARIVMIENSKGGVPRPIWVPVDVLLETRCYIEGERARVMKQNDVSEHGFLFVNPESARQRAGQPVLRDTMTKWFREAITAAGLVRRFVDPSRVNASVNQFLLHDLRHTCAVWTYVALREAGDPEPWKKVQARLGHRTLQTTINIYLAFIEADEVKISKILQSYHDRWVQE